MTNIALFIDGTGNEGTDEGEKNTNVYKLYVAAKADGAQKKHYIRGVGTGYKYDGTYRQCLIDGHKHLNELCLGAGATKKIKEGYLFLAKHFQAGDKVFLFGFSRGAFIARALAGFINRVGLLFAPQAKHLYIEYAFYLYWKDQDSPRFSRFLRDMRTMQPASRDGPVTTHFLGQWDTVEALTVAGTGASSEQKLREIAAREQDNPLPCWISHARHALAIHELRNAFTPLLWAGHDETKQTLQQVWFAGAHADVGGGYAADEAPGHSFSDIALAWMMDEARAHRLRFNSNGPDIDRDPVVAAPHDSWTGKFRLLPAQTRTIDRGSIHDSFIARTWELPGKDYFRFEGLVRIGWEEGDKAAMRQHFTSCYPTATLVSISPNSLLEDLDRLTDALGGGAPITDSELSRILALLTIFGGIVTDLVPLSINRRAWEPRLLAAKDVVLNQLAQSSDQCLAHRRKLQVSILNCFVLQKTLALIGKRTGKHKI